MKLSILIATVPERSESFRHLYQTIQAQTEGKKEVEVIFSCLPKELISIGAKRQWLLEQAKGEYVCFIDDDDYPLPNYIQEIIKAIETKPDCVGMNILMFTNFTNPQTCNHSLKNKIWHQDRGVYYRTVTQFNPVKRELALEAGFPDLRFGEDKVYSDKLTKLCKSEVMIDPYIYLYQYSNKTPHNQKYGIK